MRINVLPSWLTNVTVSRTLFCLLIVLCLGACDTNKGPTGPDEQIVYQNSFEIPSDVAGWEGIGANAFRSDAPPNGGNQSLFISGGCIGPHAYFDLQSITEDSYLLLRCWGKDLSTGGIIGLELPDYSSGISLSIGAANWTAYQSADTLFCPADQRVRLWMSAGGIIYSAMLIDLIEIVRVK